MSRRGTLTAADVAWAVEQALGSYEARWVERELQRALTRGLAVRRAKLLLAGWGSFGPDGRVAGEPFAPAGALSVERDGRQGVIAIAEVVDAVRDRRAPQEALF